MSRGSGHTWVWPADSRCAKDSLRMWGMKQVSVKAEAQPRAAQVHIEASGLKKLNLGHDRKPRGPRMSDKLDYNRRTVTRKVTKQRTALAIPSRERHSSSRNTRSGETAGAGRPHTRAVGKGWLDRLLCAELVSQTPTLG